MAPAREMEPLEGTALLEEAHQYGQAGFEGFSLTSCLLSVSFVCIKMWSEPGGDGAFL